MAQHPDPKPGPQQVLIAVEGFGLNYADIMAASKSGADAILLPKVESANAIRQLEAIMVANGAPEAMAIWAMMETPRGVLRAEAIADSSNRL